MQFSEKITEISKLAERDLAPIFAKIDEISYENTNKVMDAFREPFPASPAIPMTSSRVS